MDGACGCLTKGVQRSCMEGKHKDLEAVVECSCKASGAGSSGSIVVVLVGNLQLLEEVVEEMGLVEVTAEEVEDDTGIDSWWCSSGS